MYLFRFAVTALAVSSTLNPTNFSAHAFSPTSPLPIISYTEVVEQTTTDQSIPTTTTPESSTEKEVDNNFYNSTHYNNFDYRNTYIRIQGLYNNTAESMEECIRSLSISHLPTHGEPWCNATFDTVICWPATPGGQHVWMRCPDLKAFDTRRNVSKFCHSSGRWLGKNETDFSRPHGYTPYSLCFSEEVKLLSEAVGSAIAFANDIARYIRYLEFVGLALSVCALTIGILIFASFRRLRVFRNMLHLQLMIAILMVSLIRLVIYIDLEFTDKLAALGNAKSRTTGRNINTMPIICEGMYFLLEYFKCVAFWWSFLEGIYLHNQLVIAFSDREPNLGIYMTVGYGAPLVHSLIWLSVVIQQYNGAVHRCLGNYYLMASFWILDGVRLFQLVVNTLIVCNVIRVLWRKVCESHNSNEMDKMKKSVKAAFMLIPLLGIPNIMQTIPIQPTEKNIWFFAIWTFLASASYMFQGLVISIIYCFTNKEVQGVLLQYYNRFKLQHTTGHELRRGSKSQTSHYQTKNGNGNHVSKLNGSNKKSSGDSASNLLLPHQRTSLQSCERTSVTSISCDLKTPLANVDFESQSNQQQSSNGASEQQYGANNLSFESNGKTINLDRNGNNGSFPLLRTTIYET